VIELQGIEKSFGDIEVIRDLSLDIPAGSFFILIGPSGCGKSTLLKMINALIRPDKGRVLLRGQDITAMAPDELRRGIGYAIQSIGLFPHWTVAQNIAAQPRLLRWKEARIKARIEELRILLQLDHDLLDRYPHQLSGGQQQRVGVARALAADPDLILMDEPFGALDPITRLALQDEMKRIHRASSKTIVFVTHDMEEALKLGTSLAILSEGKLLQSGTPEALLMQPKTKPVRDFLGGPELPLRRLEVLTVATRMTSEILADKVWPSIAETARLKEALALMIAAQCRVLHVTDASGRTIGTLRIEDLIAEPKE
jgi:osmoprotectant transport system ATP-binding protein